MIFTVIEADWSVVLSTESQEEIDKLNEEMAELFEQMGTYKDACVKVTRDIYSGVRVIVSEEHLVINQSLSHCKFVKEREMVKAVPI